jgi:hypothetical protein
MAVGLAVAMAVTAAVMFAVAAVAQNNAVSGVVRDDARPVVGGAEFRRLARSGSWLSGVGLTAFASIVHATALVLAPLVIVQPIGVLSVPIAVVLAAHETRTRPPASVLVAVGVCVGAVTGFVAVADASLATSVAPRLSGALTAVLGTGAAVGALALWASRRSGWARCATFAAAGATAFGLVSALMRLVSLHLTSGVNDLDDVGVWLPALGITAALAGGGWAVQQAHAAGPPAVVVGCLTVIDPLVAVGLGMAMLGERTAATAGVPLSLGGFAILGLSAALCLAQRYPQGSRA